MKLYQDLFWGFCRALPGRGGGDTDLLARASLCFSLGWLVYAVAGITFLGEALGYRISLSTPIGVGLGVMYLLLYGLHVWAFSRKAGKGPVDDQLRGRASYVFAMKMAGLLFVLGALILGSATAVHHADQRKQGEGLSGLSTAAMAERGRGASASRRHWAGA